MEPSESDSSPQPSLVREEPPGGQAWGDQPPVLSTFIPLEEPVRDAHTALFPPPAEARERSVLARDGGYAARGPARARREVPPHPRGHRGRLVLAAALTTLGVALCAAPPRADVIEADSERVAEVTVYPDRAEVVRVATVALPAGTSTVEFRDIPAGIEADSLRVSGRGVTAVLGTVELGDRVDLPETPADLAAATAEVERIQHELATLDAEEAVASAMRDYLSTVKTVSTDRSREKLADGKPDPAAIGAMYDLLRTRLQEQGREGLARRIRREKLDKEMTLAQQRFNSARPAPAMRTRVASVEVDAPRAGSLTLRLSYFAPGASWRPTYRATLDPASKRLALVAEAVVHQTTGEDWSGVTLHLSTATPSRGVTPPVLVSWTLRPISPMAGEEYGGAVGGFGKILSKRDGYPNVLTLAPGVNAPSGDGPNVHGSREGNYDAEGGANVDPLTGQFLSNLDPDAIDDLEIVTSGAAATSEHPLAPPPPSPSTAAVVSVVRSSYTVTFDVPGHVDVPGDGHEHRVVLRGEDLVAALEYRALPSLQPAAFLIAKTRAPEGFPLLAGPVRVFSADAYLGSYALAETAPGADLRIPFGVDNRIKVARTTLPQARTHEGFSGKDRKIAYAYRTTFENLGDQAVALVVEDRLPISEDDRIEVERGKGTTTGWREIKDRPGIVEWTVALAPREKRELQLEYAVRVPKEIALAGL